MKTMLRRAAAALPGLAPKRQYALAAFLVWVGITVKFFGFTDAGMMDAMAGSYGAVTTEVFLFVTAVLGLNQWADSTNARLQAGRLGKDRHE